MKTKDLIITITAVIVAIIILYIAINQSRNVYLKSNKKTGSISHAAQTNSTSEGTGGEKGNVTSYEDTVEDDLQYSLELPYDWEFERALIDGYTAKNYDVGTGLTFRTYFSMDTSNIIVDNLLASIEKGNYQIKEIVSDNEIVEKNLFGDELKSNHMVIKLEKEQKKFIGDVYVYRTIDQVAELIFLNYEVNRNKAKKEMLELRECLELVPLE